MPVKNYIYLADPNDKYSQNSGFKAEDYSMYLNLEVETYDRFSGKSNSIGVKSTNNSKLTFYSGTKIDKNSKHNFLTTNYASYTAKDVENGETNDEGLQLASVDISYNSWLYPQVSIKFVDVRGISLMMPNQLAYSKNNKDLVSRFFRCFFMFPYPRFILHVKGYHGQMVTYTLCVSNFKSEFNSDTGNFEINVDFIGYMYGALTDIPMRHIIAAPYCDYQKDYWKHNLTSTFKFDDGRPMMTLVNLIGNIETLKNKIFEKSGIIKSMADLKQSTMNEELLITIKDNYKLCINKINGLIKKPENNYTKLYKPDKTNEYLYVIYIKDWSLNNGVNGSMNRCFGDIITLVTNLKTSIDNFNNSSSKKIDTTDKIFDFLKTDDVFLQNLTLIDGANLDGYYYEYKAESKFLNTIDAFSNTNTKIKDILKKTVIETQGILASEILGFTPNVKNITKLVFAHLETYVKNINTCIENIRNNNSGDRNIKSLNMKSEDTDLNNKVTNIPPFPRIMQNGEEIYMYDYTKKETEETIFVDEFVKTYKKIYEEIDRLSYDANIYNYDINNKVVKFIPSILSDLFYFEASFNPYGILVKEGAKFTDIVTLFYYRCAKFLCEKQQIYSNNKEELMDEKFISSEAFNFFNAFPSEKLDTSIQTIFKNISGGNSIANLTNITSRISPINLENIPIHIKDMDKDVKFGYKYDTQHKGIGYNDTVNAFIFELKGGGDIYGKILKNISDLNQGINYTNFKVSDFSDYIIPGELSATRKTIFTNQYNKPVIKKLNGDDKTFYYQQIDDKNKNERVVNVNNAFNKFCVTEPSRFLIPNLSVDNGKTLCGHNFYYLQNTWGNKNLPEIYGFNTAGIKIKEAAKALLFLSTLPLETNLNKITNKIFGNANDSREHGGCACIPKVYILLMGGYILREKLKNNGESSVDMIITKDVNHNNYLQMFLGDGSLLLSTEGGFPLLENDNTQVENLVINEFLKWLLPPKDNNDTSWENIKKRIELTNNDSEITSINSFLEKSIIKKSTIEKSIAKSTAYDGSYALCSDGDDYGDVSLRLRMINGDSGVKNPIPNLISELCYLVVTDTKGTYNSYGKKSATKINVSNFNAEINRMFVLFSQTLNNKYYKNTEESAIYKKMANEISVTNNLKLSTYNTFKSLYDKWLCSNDMTKFNLEKGYFNNFKFIDSLYNDISDRLVINLDWLIDALLKTGHSNENSDMSVYEFIYEMCSKHGLLMMALPLFNNWGDTKQMEEIFEPIPVSKMNSPSDESMFVCMYPHKPSQFLDIEEDDYKYKGDSFMFDEKNRVNSGLNQENAYKLPAFGVSYGKANQSIFKNISVNMDNPQVTEQSIAILLELAKKGDSSNGAVNIKFTGQDLFDIYSNYSYTCTVDMMGCMQIMPLMYFQLNSIPMFNGAYVIIKVKHNITPGNISTSFTGVRMSKNTMKFNEKVFELETILNTNLPQIGSQSNITNDNDIMTIDAEEIVNNKHENVLEAKDFKLLKFNGGSGKEVFILDKGISYDEMFNHLDTSLINVLYDIGVTATEKMKDLGCQIRITSIYRERAPHKISGKTICDKTSNHNCYTGSNLCTDKDEYNCTVLAVDIKPSEPGKDDINTKILADIIFSYWKRNISVIWESSNSGATMTNEITCFHIEKRNDVRIYQAYDKIGDKVIGGIDKLSPRFLNILKELRRQECTAISLNFDGVKIRDIPTNKLPK